MGKTAIVTGAAKGIGRAIAVKLAQSGYDIALNYRSGLSAAFVEELEGYGVKVEAYQCDVSSFEDTGAMVKAVKKEFGSIDLLVNNAGITNDKLIMRMSEADFDSVLDINLKGTFHMVRHVSPVMLKQKSGSIVNISSVVGVAGNPGQANYAASKAGIIGLSKSVARELASRNITCNVVAPGYIDTDMSRELPEEARDAILSSIPLNRIGSVEDVAAAVLFLAENKYITGQVLNVNGGMVMQ